jgi:hypothetical protein
MMLCATRDWKPRKSGESVGKSVLAKWNFAWPYLPVTSSSTMGLNSQGALRKADFHSMSRMLAGTGEVLQWLLQFDRRIQGISWRLLSFGVVGQFAATGNTSQFQGRVENTNRTVPERG